MAAAIAVLVALDGCASGTSLVDSWTSPSAAQLDFQKVLVVAITQNEPLRREAEDAMARSLGRARAVPSYAFLTVDELRVPPRIRSKVAEAGFDGAVTLRLIAPAEQRAWLPGRYPDPYYDFWAYQDWVQRPQPPGAVAPDEKVRFETNVYDVTKGRLIWAGLSEGVRPKDVTELVDDVAAAVAQELRRKGLLT